MAVSGPEVDMYEIRFDDEVQIRRRFVHALWQDSPLHHLAVLIDLWRVSVAPEIVFGTDVFDSG